MKKKYFISCITPTKQLGAMQFECTEDEVQQKSMKMCPEPAEFRAYEIPEFEENMPIDEFVPTDKMKQLGY